MISSSQTCTNRPGANLKGEGSIEKRMKDSSYNRAKARDLKGRPREVILVDPEHLLQTYNAQFELKADVHKALEAFAPVEKRVLLRVLVQRQSIEEATKYMKHGREKWRVWLRTIAITALRTALADYCENGKVVLT